MWWEWPDRIVNRVAWPISTLPRSLFHPKLQPARGCNCYLFFFCLRCEDFWHHYVNWKNKSHWLAGGPICLEVPSVLGLNPTSDLCHITPTSSIIHLQSKQIRQTLLNPVTSSLAGFILTTAQRTGVKDRMQFVLGELSKSKNICKSQCTTTSLYLTQK